MRQFPANYSFSICSVRLNVWHWIANTLDFDRYHQKKYAPFYHCPFPVRFFFWVNFRPFRGELPFFGKYENISSVRQRSLNEIPCIKGSHIKFRWVNKINFWMNRYKFHSPSDCISSKQLKCCFGYHEKKNRCGNGGKKKTKMNVVYRIAIKMLFWLVHSSASISVHVLLIRLSVTFVKMLPNEEHS